MERKEDEKNRRKDTKNVKKKDEIKLRRERSRKRMGNRDHIYICVAFFMTNTNILLKLKIYTPIVLAIQNSSDQLAP